MNFSINHKIFNYIISSPVVFSANNFSFLYRIYEKPSLAFILPASLGAACNRNVFKRRSRFLFQKIVNDVRVPSLALILKPKIINLNYKHLDDAFQNFIFHVLKTS